MSNSEQEAIELETASLEHAIGMGEAWLRLQRNGDFKKIITDGYMKTKVLASVSLLGVPQIKDNGMRPAVVEDLISASCLGYYFKIIEHEYEGAMQPILTDDEAEAAEALELEREQAQLTGAS
jgi:hypothetical protein